MRKIRILVFWLLAAMIFQRLLTKRPPEMATAPSGVKRKPSGQEPVKSKKSDPLTAINGIGPAFERALNAIGVYSFADLARQDADDLAARLTARVTAERIRRDGWIEQAQARTQSD
jgi:large subunit ribosomal protein L21